MSRRRVRRLEACFLEKPFLAAARLNQGDLVSQFTVARIAARLFNTPLMLRPETAIAIASNLASRFDVEAMDEGAGLIENTPEASRFRGQPAGARDDGRPMYRAENGVAVIPVLGELVNRGAWIGAYSGLTSYEGLDAQLRAAAADPSVRGILLDMNSPGGEASGAIETGALVRAISADKPVVALVNAMAASAGYAIASGAKTIVTTPSGLAGSIGVVMLHIDRSAAMAKAGLKPTLIHAGAYKVDGSAMAPLEDAARARIQASIDGVHDLFVGAVAKHRGLDPAAVRATEGGVLMGQGAVDAGLADRLGSFDTALALFKPKPSTFAGVSFMSTEPVPAVAPPALAPPQALSPQAVIAAERARAGAILGAPEAAGREAMARKLAFETDLSAEAAIALLATAPAASAPPAPARNRLVVENPDIKTETTAPAADAFTPWDKIAAAVNAEAGFAK